MEKEGRMYVLHVGKIANRDACVTFFYIGVNEFKRVVTSPLSPFCPQGANEP